MIDFRALAAGCVLLSVTITATAQTNPGAQACAADADSVYCLCRDGGQTPQAAVFPELAEAAVAVREQFCRGLLSRDDVSALVLDFVADNRTWESRIGGFDGDLAGTLLQLSNAEGGPLGLTDAFVNDDDEIVVRVLDQRFAIDDVASCASAAGSVGSEVVRCERAVQEFVDIYAYAQKTYAAFDEYPFAKNVRALRADWDRFFNASRGMTSLELLLNSRLHRRDERTQFSGPPDKQWVLLHPGIVIENVRSAADGDQLEEALALDVFGINFWREDRWYVPSGGAFTVLYSDKANTDDFGVGVQLYFKNAYSIGYSNRGGDNGVFISVDLLKFFRNKQSELDSFLN